MLQHVSHQSNALQPTLLDSCVSILLTKKNTPPTITAAPQHNLFGHMRKEIATRALEAAYVKECSGIVDMLQVAQSRLPLPIVVQILGPASPPLSVVQHLL